MWSTPLPPATQQRPDTTEPGEFTRFFASPLASSSLPIEDIEQGRIPEAKAPADRPFEGPGEFTRWFGKSVPGDKTPAPSPPAQFPTFGGQATGVFEAPQVRGPQGTPTPGERKGPSEYTGIMAAPRVEEPAAYVPGAKPGKGPLIVVVIVCVVVLVLLGVVIILSMRR